MDNGMGVYNDISNTIAASGEGKMGSHPVPTRDMGMCERWNAMPDREQAFFFFGFRSVEQLMTWFPHPERFSDGVVYKVYEVEVQHVIIGHAQVVFVKEHATVVETLHPAALKSEGG